MDFGKLKIVFLRFGIKPILFVIPTLLSVLAAFCEGAGVGVLIPTIKGILAMNFNFVKDLPVLKNILGYLFQGANIGNTAVFILLISIIFVASLFKNILQYISSLMVTRQVRRISHNMRAIIFERYLSLGKLFFDQSNTGHLQNVLLNFVNMIINQMRGAELALAQLFMLIVYLCIMFIISVRLTLVVLLFAPVLYYSMKWLTGKLKRTSRHYAYSFGELSKKLSNILSCIPLVKLYSNEENEKNNFAVLNDQMENLEFSLAKKGHLIVPLQETIMLVAVLFLVSLMSFMVVKEKVGEVASFLVYFYILRMSLKSFGTFSNLVANLAMANGPIAEISELLDDKNKSFILDGSQECQNFKEKLELRNLNFSYLPNQQILHNLCLNIEKGKLTALVGPTGAGKSTIINLIIRFYDCPPETIFIDGVDIRNFTLKSLMRHMALVAQDTLLFNDTLRNNIIYGLEKYVPEEKLFGVLDQARLTDFVKSLPKGLDTFIGDKGIRLSGGEKQRVAIARAILKEAEILFLDEATSSLDTTTEKLIQAAIEEAVKNRTTVVIAHRLSTIKNADWIAVIENGRVAEEGTLTQLLEMKGKFYRFWEEQRFY